MGIARGEGVQTSDACVETETSKEMKAKIPNEPTTVLERQVARRSDDPPPPPDAAGRRPTCGGQRDPNDTEPSCTSTTSGHRPMCDYPSTARAIGRRITGDSHVVAIDGIGGIRIVGTIKH